MEKNDQMDEENYIERARSRLRGFLDDYNDDSNYKNALEICNLCLGSLKEEVQLMEFILNPTSFEVALLSEDEYIYIDIYSKAYIRLIINNHQFTFSFEPLVELSVLQKVIRDFFDGKYQVNLYGKKSIMRAELLWTDEGLRALDQNISVSSFSFLQKKWEQIDSFKGVSFIH